MTKRREPPAGGTRTDSSSQTVHSASEALTQALDSKASGEGGTELVASQQLGPYRLIRRLGEGGMGMVWLVEQTEPVGREVALKLMHTRLDSSRARARFELEGQMLARMTHPGIAHVYDAGTTAHGYPWLAMEYVPGEPITTFCDHHGLAISQRLELFVRVCHAVQHAHQKGILHRDLKPDNILVGEIDGQPVPRLIDFGIAISDKARKSRDAGPAGTPRYMSPEQANPDGAIVDTRSDIFALGLVMFELLVGQRAMPAELSQLKLADGLHQAILAELPVRPSEHLQSDSSRYSPGLLKRLRSDLDWIVLKATATDPEQRYASAQDLAMDIQQHLGHWPVTAAPGGHGYRLGKFWRRNRLAVSAAGGMVATVLVGLIATAVALSEATRQRDGAETARAEAEQIAQFQAERLAGLDTVMMGIDIRQGHLQQRQETLAGQLEDAQLIEAAQVEFETALASVNYTDLTREVLHRYVFEPTLAAIETQFADTPLMQARLLQDLVITMRELGLYYQAERPQQQALALRREHLGEDAVKTLSSVHQAGRLWILQGRYEEAETLLTSAYQRAGQVLGDDHPVTLSLASEMWHVFWKQHDYQTAVSYARHALEGRQRILGREHPDTLQSMNDMGIALYELEQWDQARALYQQTLDLRRQVLGEQHSLTMQSLNNLGFLLLNEGQFDEAEPLYRTALETRRQVNGDRHPETLLAASNLGHLLLQRGDLKAARTYLAETYHGRKQILGPAHPDTALSTSLMGSVLREIGRLEEAESMFMRAMEIRRSVYGEDHPLVTFDAFGLAKVVRLSGRLNEAEDRLTGLVDQLEAAYGEQSLLAMLARHHLARTYSGQGRHDEALGLHRSVLDQWNPDQNPSQTPWRQGQLLRGYGRSLTAAGRFEEAEQALLSAQQVFDAHLDQDHYRLHRVQAALDELNQASDGRIPFRSARQSDAG